MERARPYHHGDLAEALVGAGVEAARSGGSSAVTLRELAKSVGVSPAAAYRHYPSLDHLVAAVSQRAREQLAEAMIEARDGVQPGSDDAATVAWRRLRAVGEAYVRFALREPRLFETAFAPCPVPPARVDDPAAWTVLLEALDAMAAAGALPAHRRPAAPYIAWAAVHGLAGIVTSQGAPPGGGQGAAIDAVLDGVRRALVT